MAKTESSLFLGCFHPILFILADNNDMHENSEDFEIWPDLTTHCGVSCPWVSEKLPIVLKWEKWYCHFFSAILDQILFILQGNDDIHKSSDEFEIRPDQIRSGTTDLAKSSTKKSMLPLFLISQLWFNLGNSQVSVYRTICPLVL